jgi:predicted flavoprotein YhiN
MNTDLTKFNLQLAGYNVSVLPTTHDESMSDVWRVAIYNNNEQITFTLPPALSYEKALQLMTKVEKANIVNLTLWDAMPKHIWEYVEPEKSEEEVREEQLAEQKCEFISAYIHAGGDQFDALTEWNAKEH